MHNTRMYMYIKCFDGEYNMKRTYFYLQVQSAKTQMSIMDGVPDFPSGPLKDLLRVLQ